METQSVQTFWQLITSLNQVSVFFWIFSGGSTLAFVFFLSGEVFDGLEDVFHGVFEMFHLDAIFHIDVDSGGPSVFSPRVISVFVTIFGAAGLLATIGKQGPVSSSMIALASAVVIGVVFFAVFRWIYNQQSSTSLNNSELVGSSGIITTEIPEGGIGVVVIDFVGSRITRSAKSATSVKVPVNSTVTVKEVHGQLLVVS